MRSKTGGERGLCGVTRVILLLVLSVLLVLLFCGGSEMVYEGCSAVPIFVSMILLLLLRRTV